MRELNETELKSINGGDLSDVNWPEYAGGSLTLLAGTMTGNPAMVALGSAAVIDSTW